MGVNLGLRLLTLGLSVILLLLIAYYFLVVNRTISPQQMSQQTILLTQETERKKADAALTNKVKSAIAQTKRLPGYSIIVECKDSMIILLGEVPTEIDKDFAEALAKETAGVKEVNNQLRIIPGATPQPIENIDGKADLSVNVEDLELQANLRERIMESSELKNQHIEVKVQNRAVTLSGNVASEQLKVKAEQIIHNVPKVAAIINSIKISGNKALAPADKMEK